MTKPKRVPAETVWPEEPGTHASGLVAAETHVESFRQALEIKPGLAGTHDNLGNALKELGRFDEAIALSRRSQRQANSAIFSHLAEISALGNLGRSEEARDAIRRAREKKPDVSIGYVAEALPITDPRCREVFHGGLRKAGLPDPG